MFSYQNWSVDVWPSQAPWPFFVHDVVAGKRTATSGTAGDSILMGGGGWAATTSEQSLTLELPRLMKVIGFISGKQTDTTKHLSTVRVAFGRDSAADIVYVADEGAEFVLSGETERHFFKTPIQSGRWIRFYLGREWPII